MLTTRVSLDDVETTTTKALVAHGAKPWIAEQVAMAVRKAEATGNLICGLYYLESYCTQLVSGRVNGVIDPVVTTPKPASVHVDAGFGFAQAAFHKALPKALDVAREMGTASLAVAHAHTCTSLGYFTAQIAEAGFVALGLTNASAVVSPPGGTAAVLGTNPIAFAVPARDEGIAFQFDQSTSAIALGKITMAATAGEEIPLGWAVDAAGNPTTDPNEALKGSLMSSGGYKGWGFGLMAEVLAAAMTGSVNSLNVKGLKLPDGPPHDLGQFYLILDPSVHSDSAFWDRLDVVADAVAQQPNARLPGSNVDLPEMVQVKSSVWDSVCNLANR